MAIVKMNKFNLLSFEEKRSSLLNILQNFNYVHFNDLEISEGESYLKEVKNETKLNALDESLEKLHYSIETVNEFAGEENTDLKRLDLDRVYKAGGNFDFDLIYDKLIKLVKEREGLVEKRQALSQKIDDLSPWKDIDTNLSNLYDSKRVYLETGSISSQFYDTLKKTLVEKHLDESMVHRYSEADKLSYIVAISSLDEEEEFKEILREFGFVRIRVRAEGSVLDSLKNFESERKTVGADIEKLEAEIADFSKYLEDFYLYESYLENERKKEASAEFFLKTKSMDVIEGYLPATMTERFKKDLEEVLGDKYILDIKEASKDDPKVPIILENNKIVEPYESVVETYALPRYDEFDPSLLVAIFYSIFTGFMIGD